MWNEKTMDYAVASPITAVLLICCCTFIGLSVLVMSQCRGRKLRGTINYRDISFSKEDCLQEEPEEE